jgi:2Fe-2S ferredoxin
VSKIRFIQQNGDIKDIQGAVGESLMRLALANDIEGIVGECGGEMSCATCHVHVEQDFQDRLEPLSTDEIDLLEMTEFYREGCSRLSCQIRVSQEIEGLEVHVAPEN